jgi:hypothetical protein
MERPKLNGGCYSSKGLYHWISTGLSTPLHWSLGKIHSSGNPLEWSGSDPQSTPIHPPSSLPMTYMTDGGRDKWVL